MRNQSRKKNESPGPPVADKTSVQLIEANKSPSSCLKNLNHAIAHSAAYEHTFVGDYAPSDRCEKYLYVQQLRLGLCRPCVLCTYSIGGPVGKYSILNHSVS